MTNKCPSITIKCVTIQVASEQLCAPSQVVAHSSNGGGDQDAPGSRRGMQRIPSLASSSVPMLR